MKYVVITAARNEEKYIENTLRSVCSQTQKPIKWVIVSDSSTDRTDEIVREYARDNPFISLLCRSGDKKRNFGSQVYAIKAGYDTIKDLQFDLIGNLDADVSFEPQYFETLAERIKANPRIGIAGGWIQERQNGVFCDRKSNSLTSVPHAVQLFRRDCFMKIGGYTPLRYGGPDWLAEIMARMNGWEVMPFVDLKVGHHRPTNGAENVLQGAWRDGYQAYSIGSHPVFEAIKTIRRIPIRAYSLFSTLRFIGFMTAYIKHDKREAPREVVRFLRKEQMSRASLFFIKK